jgi:hypothetical protein
MQLESKFCSTVLVTSHKNIAKTQKRLILIALGAVEAMLRSSSLSRNGDIKTQQALSRE